jgi:hypothetical protein
MQIKIQAFSKESLTKLEVYLMQENTPDELFGLTAECLAVLDIEDEMVGRVLERVGGLSMERLLAKLMEAMPLDSLINLMNHRAERPSILNLCLAKQFMLVRPSETAFEQAFKCLLRQATLNLQSIDFVEDLADNVSISQLAQLNRALSRNPRADEAVERLGRLRLKEASQVLREGDNEAAISIVKGLRISPGLEEEALRFYEAADCIDGKLLIHKQRLSTYIQVLSGENPRMAEGLELVHQVFTTEQELLRREQNDSLRHFRQAVEHLYVINGQRTPSINPPCIYSYRKNSNELYRTSLLSGELSCHAIPFNFILGSSLSELPGEALLITGGTAGFFFQLIQLGVRDVVSIDTRTFEVSSRTMMTTARHRHAAVYHDHHVYVLGGGASGRNNLRECERYVCAEDRWEELPSLLTACRNAVAVVMDRTLYAIGGYTTTDLDLIQVLRLDSTHWESIGLPPSTGKCIACFKVSDTQAYFVLNRNLYSFKPQQAVQFQPVKLLTQDILSKRGPSYYSNGYLYCSSDKGAAKGWPLGSLS